MQRLRDRLSQAPVVPVIKLFGQISPPSGRRYQPGVINFHSVKPLLERAFKQRRMAALALRINSPGGWPVQCDLIRNEILRLSAKRGNIPVLAFVEDLAASGGYYLACSANEIYANRHSLIGSIGALGVHLDLQTALKERASLALTVNRAGKRKAIGTNLEPITPDSAKFTRYMLDGIHAGFIDVVKSARGDRLKGAPESDLFEGDIWLADKAKQLGLIDGFGDLEDVVAEKFGSNARLVEVGPRPWDTFSFGGVSAVAALLSNGLLGGIGGGLPTSATNAEAAAAAAAVKELIGGSHDGIRGGGPPLM